jgi:hypothetical protein
MNDDATISTPSDMIFRFITEKGLQVLVHLILPTAATNTTPNSTVRYLIAVVTYSDVSAPRELQRKSGMRQHTPRSEHRTWSCPVSPRK